MRKKGKGTVLSNVILVIAVIVFVFSAYKLIGIYLEYHKGDKEYDSIAEEAIEIQSSEPEESEKEEEQQKSKVHTTLKVDFNKLRKTNQEVVAWIQFDEPKQINYPVVKSFDNNKYLERSFIYRC